MGYMSPALDEIQQAFVDHCDYKKYGRFLDIGCGFGIATLPVIQKKRRIVACDLDQRHLDVLMQDVPQEKRVFVTPRAGHFPETIVFPENTFEGINLSMVIHFLSPQSINMAFKNLFVCLKKGGLLFITTSSPYQGVLSSFISTYESKKTQYRDEWPGYIENIADYVPHRAPLLPKRNIVFCPHELSRLAAKFGFHVVDSISFSRESIPDDLRLDGREYSGLICEKPSSTAFVFLEKNKEKLPTQAANII
jgi:SAM-dependent methyltransferase